MPRVLNADKKQVHVPKELSPYILISAQREKLYIHRLTTVIL